MQILVSRVVLPGVMVYFAFSWLVVPVIVSVAGTEATAVSILVLVGLFYV